MKDHSLFEELLPLYAAGSLTGKQKEQVEKHLATCQECQSDLLLWHSVSGEIQAEYQGITTSAKWADHALERIHRPNRLVRGLAQAWQLLRGQTLLVKNEMWPVSAIVMVMGILVSLIAQKVNVVAFLAPIVAATTLAALYGPENDLATELTLSTPTSTWKILFARMSIVSCYNLVLSLVASFV